jgi:hypothetical protein
MSTSSESVDFSGLYREVYAAIGQPLRRKDGFGTAVRKFRTDFAHTLPRALRDYYAVAAHRGDLHSHYNRLLLPEEMYGVNGRAVFSEENECVVWWGYPIEPAMDDPMVYQCPDLDHAYWYRETRLSTFLCAALVTEVAFGGAMGNSAAITVPQGFDRRIARAGFRSWGSVSGMKTFAGDGVALAYSKWEDDYQLFYSFSQAGKIDDVEDFARRDARTARLFRDL